MFESPLARAGGILALFAVLGGLLVWYGSLGLAPGAWVLPGATHLEDNYEDHVGDRVEFQVTVVSSDPVVAESAFGEGPAHTLRVTLTGLESEVKPGDRLAVYGVAQPDHTVAVKNAYVVPRENYVAVYLVSALAGLWVIGRLALTWQVDADEMALKPRDRQLTVGDLVRVLRRRS